MNRIATVDDLRDRARRRLPGFAFDYLDGGAGGEGGAARNVAAFDALGLTPRVLTDVTRRDLSVAFLGRAWGAPFGIAPVGMAGLFWPGGEAALARAAVAANIPFGLSTVGTTTLEDIAAIAGPNGWFQLYASSDDAQLEDVVARAEAAGYDVLMVTLDVPVPSRRPREIRRALGMPFRVAPKTVMEIATRPEWALATFLAGRPRLANLEPYVVDGKPLTSFMKTQLRADLTPAVLRRLRDRWPRRLVAKGIMHPDDARLARDCGCDGIVISNHGGRQLDSAPAPIAALPAIRAALGPDFPLVLDGGVRSGEHIVKALAAGADFVLLGRACYYAVAALGPAGAQVVIDLLIDELSKTMAQIGCTAIDRLKDLQGKAPRI